MNTNEALALLWLVKAHWPRFEIFGTDQLPLQAGAWLDVLDDIPLPDARAAVANLAVTGREFPPTAGHVRIEALRLRSRTNLPTGDQALTEVREQIRRVGYIGTPTFTHPAITETITAIGGWHEACASENPEAFRAHFLRLYATATERHERQARTPSVVAELSESLAKTLALTPATGDGPRTHDDRVRHTPTSGTPSDQQKDNHR